MLLYVISDYKSSGYNCKKGDVIEVSPIEAERLLADSFGSFSKEEPRPVVEAPPKDKAVRASRTTRKAPTKRKTTKK